MKKLIFFSLWLILSFLITNCTKAPVYPETPEIKFESYTQYSTFDSLTINLKFKDGDADLGLGDAETSFPYQKFNFVLDNSGNYVEIGSQPSLPPYNCFDYSLVYLNGDTIDFDQDGTDDTLRITKNIFNNNYIIELYVKQGSSFVLYDFSPFCVDYNGRFPYLSDKDEKGPIEGTLSYTLKDLVNPFGEPDFKGEIIKFKIYIIDRALHKSNVIETPEIQIN